MTDTQPSNSAKGELSFDNTELAFSHLSDGELSFSHFIFSMMNSPLFVRTSSWLAMIALKLRLPITGLVKATIFRQFCGGESIEESFEASKRLGEAGIGAILDYSVEGIQKEEDFEKTASELLRVIDLAKQHDHIPIACMKVTGIARFELLEKESSNAELSNSESLEFDRVKKRLDSICKSAFEADMPVYIDAEESWIQPAIDRLTEDMMHTYNKKKAIVFTTMQLYRHDRLAYLIELIKQARESGYVLGVKLVRGAYLEKERNRAEELGYLSPIQTTKANTDKDYNKALEVAVDNIDNVEVCAGTHNEKSCMLLTELMAKHNLSNDHPNIYFSQLFGMSDYMSYNLARAGYNVTKYLPYGPVKSAVPYLIRRAQENTAIAGQMGKELTMIRAEKKRRKIAS